MDRRGFVNGEERFRVALKSSPVVVFKQDLGMRYTCINSRAAHPAKLRRTVCVGER